MNIEEERKAFEAHFADKDMKFGVNWCNEYASHITLVAWHSWLAAKTNAEEMAPRWVRVRRKGVDSEPSSYPWLVVCLESGALEDFRSEETAREWAKDNGYRVVSE